MHGKSVAKTRKKNDEDQKRMIPYSYWYDLHISLIKLDI